MFSNDPVSRKTAISALFFIVISICILGISNIVIKNRDYIESQIRGEKIIVEGEFTILDKNTTHTSFFLVSDNTFTFTLDFVNDKIKATFETYSKEDTYRYSCLEVKGVVANE